MIADHRVIADLVPVDLPVNMMIAIAWHRACIQKTNCLSVYHSTTGGLNPFTWGEMGILPLIRVYRYPFIAKTKFSFSYEVSSKSRLPMNGNRGGAVEVIVHCM